MVFREALDLPAQRTVHIEVDPLKYFCGEDGVWADHPDAGRENMTQLLAHPKVAERNIRMWNNEIRQILVTSLYFPGQFAFPTAGMKRICDHEEDPQREILLPDEILCMARSIEKERNSVFSSEQFLACLYEWFQHLELDAAIDLREFALRRMDGDEPEETVLYIVLHGITGTSCVRESIIDAFIPMLKQLRINYRIVVARDSVASRDSSQGKQDEMFTALSDDRNPTAIVVPSAEDIRIVSESKMA